ncbi:MAG: hypothetical protein WC821_00915 [archaeon]|jgi:hypothetical protein
MGLFDFLKGKKENKGFAKKEVVAKVEPPAPVKKDLGVCVPHHAKSAEEKKKLSKIKEVSPFDKLRMQHLKETAEFNKEFTEIAAQESEEPYDYEPDLGVESIDSTPIQEKQSSQKGTPVFDENDELDVAAKKMGEGYVPRFSKTAREKMGYEEKTPIVPTITGSMEVSGIYVGAETMISGRVISGKITKRMSCQLGKGTVRISDLKQSSMSVTELRSGENGTIFVRGNPGNIRNGDILDFS